MTKHLPECPAPLCNDQCAGWECPHWFFCDGLRACEARVREDERSNIDREMAFAHKVGYDRGRADIRDEGRNTG